MARNPATATILLSAAIIGSSVVAAGCGDSDGDPGADSGPTVDSGPTPDADPAPIFDDPIGFVRIVELLEYDAFDQSERRGAYLSGQIGQPGAGSFHGEAERDGRCRLLTFNLASCDPFCEGICVGTDDCRPFPTYRDAGTLTVSGLAEAMTASPSFNSTYFQNATAPDIFDGQSQVSLAASGAEVPGFTIEARGVEPLSSDLGVEKAQLIDGSDFTVTWQPAGQGARVRMRLNSATMAHGLPAATVIECDGPDDGSFTVPSSLVDQFGQGTHPICVGQDCPPSELVRYRATTIEHGGGDIRLSVESGQTFYVDRGAP